LQNVDRVRVHALHQWPLLHEILLEDENTCRKVLAEAQAVPRGDQVAFRDLVMQYSVDPESKASGGELPAFDRNGGPLPPNLVEAAFELKDIGDSTECLSSSRGWHILKLSQRRPPFKRALSEVKVLLQERLTRESREKAMVDFVGELRKEAKVEIYEENLGKVLVNRDADGGARLNFSNAPAVERPDAAIPGSWQRD